MPNRILDDLLKNISNRSLNFKRRAFAIIAFVCTLALMLAGKNNMLLSVILAVLFSFIGYYVPYVLEYRRKKDFLRKIDMDMPDLLNNIALLLESGSNIYDAIKKASEFYDEGRPLYKKLGSVVRSVRQRGQSDFIAALEDMANECGSPSVSNFTAIVIQNMRKGNSELCELFRSQSVMYRNERKNTAGKIADEATTLLLFPATIMLIAMIVVLIVPAIVQLLEVAT